jgi:hypothetical protein
MFAVEIGGVVDTKMAGHLVILHLLAVLPNSLSSSAFELSLYMPGMLLMPQLFFVETVIFFVVFCYRGWGVCGLPRKVVAAAISSS